MLNTKSLITNSFVLICLVGIIYGCNDSSSMLSSGNEKVGPGEVSMRAEKDDGYHYHSNKAYQVNVIYFVPKDLEPKENWRSRISGFMRYYQEYYRKWMKHWGYGGNNSFGLFLDNKRNKGIVKITKIEGKHPASYYPNDHRGNATGGRRIRSEVFDYFNSHPDENVNSKTFIVYVPRPDPRPAAGLPYYALGRFAFVLDKGQDPSNAEFSGGGDAHELGHALGLPHNAEPLPQRNDLGNALMHNGNHVWNEKRNSFNQNGKGSTHTSLTKMDAAILSVSQPFSRKKGNFYGSVNSELEEASGSHQNGTMYLSGRFDTNVPVSDAFIMFDPPGQGEYNRMGFSDPLVTADSFHVSIPKQRLLLTRNQRYGLSLWLIYENGARRTFRLPHFSFNNGVPEIDFHLGEVPTLPKQDWEVIDFSDEAVATGKLAENIIDEDFGTWWHSAFVGGNDPHPHTLTVDMGKKETVEGFQFTQAPYSKWRSRIKRMEIKVSNDGTNWESIGTHELYNTKLPQQVKLSSSRDFRYFKIFTRASWKGPNWNASSLAEVGVY